MVIWVACAAGAIVAASKKQGVGHHDKRRLTVAVLTGAILGIICIIGMGIRLGFAGNEILIMSAWYNRVMMGLVIGLAGSLVVSRSYNVFVRGALFGVLISGAWFLSTGLVDPLGFLAGIVYGVVIDHVASRY